MEMEDAGEGGTMGDAGAGCTRKAGGRPAHSPRAAPSPRAPVLVCSYARTHTWSDAIPLPAFVLAPRA
jgi:hypothetical protein